METAKSNLSAGLNGEIQNPVGKHAMHTHKPVPWLEWLTGSISVYYVNEGQFPSSAIPTRPGCFH